MPCLQGCEANLAFSRRSARQSLLVDGYADQAFEDIRVGQRDPLQSNLPQDLMESLRRPLRQALMEGGDYFRVHDATELFDLRRAASEDLKLLCDQK